MFENKFSFSVVIPLYNKAPHVARSIKSVLNQTYDRFELIIINDSSTDNSVEEVHKFKDSRIRLLHRLKPGSGGYAARNLGIKEAKSEWIAFLDADDEWYPDHLINMYRLSSLFPYINFMSCGWVLKEGDQLSNNMYYENHKLEGNHIITAKEYFMYCINNQHPVCTSIACINKSISDNGNLFPADISVKKGGDTYAWSKIICNHKKMAWSNHLGAIYHMDSVNMITKTTPSCPRLLNKQVYSELSEHLDRDEKKLLTRYMNRRLWGAWKGNYIRRKRNFRIITYLHWNGDLLNVLIYNLIYFLPRPIIDTLYFVIKRYKASSMNK